MIRVFICVQVIDLTKLGYALQDYVNQFTTKGTGC